MKCLCCRYGHSSFQMSYNPLNVGSENDNITRYLPSSGHHIRKKLAQVRAGVKVLGRLNEIGDIVLQIVGSRRGPVMHVVVGIVAGMAV